jgi:hypothetical protein
MAMKIALDADHGGCPDLARAATGESASYIEVVVGRMDFPAGLVAAHQRLDALYGND